MGWRDRADVEGSSGGDWKDRAEQDSGPQAPSADELAAKGHEMFEESERTGKKQDYGPILDQWRQRFEQNEKEHDYTPDVAMMGGALIAPPAALGALGRVAFNAATQAGLGAATAKAQGQDPAAAALRTGLGGLAGGALGEGAARVAGAASEGPMQKLAARAQEIADASGLSLDKAIQVAKGELSDVANSALGSGAVNLLKGGAKEYLGKLAGGLPGMALMGATGGGSNLAQGAKEVAKGILQRPAVLQYLSKVEPMGEAIGRAAASGLSALTATLFAVGRKDPQALERIKKANHNWNQSSGADYTADQ